MFAGNIDNKTGMQIVDGCINQCINDKQECLKKALDEFKDCVEKSGEEEGFKECRNECLDQYPPSQSKKYLECKEKCYDNYPNYKKCEDEYNKAWRDCIHNHNSCEAVCYNVPKEQESLMGKLKRYLGF